MEIKDLAEMLKIEGVEIFIATGDDGMVYPIKSAKFNLVKAQKKDAKIGLILKFDRQALVKQIPDEFAARILVDD